MDLLVVMPDGTDRRQAAVEMHVLLGDLPVAKDIIVTTPDHIARRGPSSERCCGRRCARERCSISEPEAATEARRWLRYASEDLAE